MATQKKMCAFEKYACLYMSCPHRSILTVSDPDLLQYGIISMVWTVQNDINADSFNLDRQVSLDKGLK